GLEHIFNQLGVAPFDATPGLERVIVAFGAPLIAKITGVVMIGGRRPLRIRSVFELRHLHFRCTSLVPSAYARRSRVEESRTVSRKQIRMPNRPQISTCRGGNRPSQSLPFTYAYGCNCSSTVSVSNWLTCVYATSRSASTTTARCQSGRSGGCFVRTY